MSAVHSKDNSAKVNSKKEKHAFRCRQLVIPIEIVRRIHDGEISAAEAYLLAIIDALVDSRGEGCWASNSYLAKWVGVKVRAVQYLISSLEEKGLLIRTMKEEIRYLETAWSRILEEEPHAKNCIPRSTRHAKNCMAPPCKKLHTDNKDKIEDRGARGKKRPYRVLPPDSFHLNGSNPTTPSKAIDPSVLEVTKELYSLMDAANLHPKKASWEARAEHIRLLHEEDGYTLQEITEAMRLYFPLHRNWHHLKMPDGVDSSKAFRRCFKWIKDKITKAKRDQGQEI